MTTEKRVVSIDISMAIHQVWHENLQGHIQVSGIFGIVKIISIQAIGILLRQFCVNDVTPQGFVLGHIDFFRRITGLLSNPVQSFADTITPPCVPCQRTSIMSADLISSAMLCLSSNLLQNSTCSISLNDLSVTSSGHFLSLQL